MAEDRALLLAEAGPREFDILEPGVSYRLKAPGLGVALIVDRLSWRHHELHGELTATTDLPGTDAIDGVLSVATFNLSSARTRSERASQFKTQSRAPEIPWHPLVEELCQRVLRAERTGEPAIALRDVELPAEPDRLINVFGFQFPSRLPSIIFGDGGATKSLLALYIGGLLAIEGYRVLLNDWELTEIDHRLRYETLFGAEMPKQLFYKNCVRPLVHETDQIKRIVRQQGIDFTIYDSVGYACHEAPETSQAALSYFQAVRQIGGGSLHIAHITKGEHGDQRPFGSAFWHNSARATWFLKPADDGDGKAVGVFNRKHNIAKWLQRPFAYTVDVNGNRTALKPADITDVPGLADRVPVRQRIRAALKKGAMTVAELAEAIEAPENTIRVNVKRGTEGPHKWLTKIPSVDGSYRIGLLAEGA